MPACATALPLGTADAESILRRFTKNNMEHPTYKGLYKLGKAPKPLFLCDYLRLESLRREIQEGLQVIENWDGAHAFSLYGKAGELASNELEGYENAGVVALASSESRVREYADASAGPCTVRVGRPFHRGGPQRAIAAGMGPSEPARNVYPEHAIAPTAGTGEVISWGGFAEIASFVRLRARTRRYAGYRWPVGEPHLLLRMKASPLFPLCAFWRSKLKASTSSSSFFQAESVCRIALSI
jgi:hypothetical protein